MIIAVDVDLTVVDTASAWKNWYKKKTGHELNLSEVTYEMGNFMHKHKDPMSFWRDENLYDELEPILWSVDTLKEMSNRGHEIIFVSHCFPSHIESKEYFLERHFPFHSGFVDTEHKHHVKADIFIDDHEKYLIPIQQRNKETKIIQHITHFNKNNKNDFAKMNWFEIYNTLKDT